MMTVTKLTANGIFYGDFIQETSRFKLYLYLGSFWIVYGNGNIFRITERTHGDLLNIINETIMDITFDEFVSILRKSLDDYIKEKVPEYTSVVRTAFVVTEQEMFMAEKKKLYGEHFAEFDEWCGIKDKEINYFRETLQTIRVHDRIKAEGNKSKYADKKVNPNLYATFSITKKFKY